jgi:hypothetical protein
VLHIITGFISLGVLPVVEFGVCGTACSVLITSYHSGDKIQKNERGGTLARMGDRGGTYRVFMGRPEGRSTLGRPIRKWEDNIKVDF